MRYYLKYRDLSQRIPGIEGCFCLLGCPGAGRAFIAINISVARSRRAFPMVSIPWEVQPEYKRK